MSTGAVSTAQGAPGLDIVSKLQQISVFSDIGPEHLQEIASKLREVKATAGEIVFAEGEPGDSMNIILAGRISIHKGGRVLKTLGAGEFFGEMALLDSSPRTAGASAVQDTTLLRLDKQAFFGLLQERFALAIGMLRALTQRIKDNNVAIGNLRDFMENRLLPLGAALSSEKNFDRLIERILTEARSLCHADAGTIYILNDGRLDFKLMFCDSPGVEIGKSFPSLPLYGENGQPDRSWVATRVALDGRSVHVADVYRAEAADFAGTRAFDLQTGYRTRSMLTVPLKNHADQVIGVLQLLNAQNESGQIIPFGSYEQLVVESLSSQAAVALNTHLLIDRQRELMVVERDVEVGRQIQADFLPEKLPALSCWEIDTRFQPAKQVSGDFFDAFPAGDGRMGLMVADVCDKGVGAALFMALTRSLLRAFGWLSEGCPLTTGAAGHLAAHLSDATADPVRLTNEYIAQFHARMNMFVTLFFGILDTSSGSLRYINAGHNPPIVVDGNGRVKARLLGTGPALGMLGGIEFEVGEQTLEPGDCLLAFTDGVTEARAPNGGLFSDKRLVGLVEEKSPASASELLTRIDDALRQFVDGHGFSDDVTMLAVRRKASE
jgi:sigma-B regulation protein RsbU (phosphoserine phosphatase)